MPISTTRGLSGSNALGSTAFSKVGAGKEFPIRRPCGADSNALTRFTLFFGGYESCEGSTSCAVVQRSISVLVEAGIHFIWRTNWPDRDHATRAGREEEVDQPVAFPARAELLHAVARARSAATRDLHWLAPA